MGIKELAGDRAGGGMPIDDLLEGLDAERREILLNALRRMALSTFEIAKACRDDGFEVEPRAVYRWRARNVAGLEYPQ